MNQFLITGTWTIEIMDVLKGQTQFLFSILTSPIAILMRKYSDYRVADNMKQYRPFKAVSH
jgi:hypothetical protein